jgi:hypothetical protein
MVALSWALYHSILMAFTGIICAMCIVFYTTIIPVMYRGVLKSLELSAMRATKFVLYQPDVMANVQALNYPLMQFHV